jgi:hypothetical protein
MLVISDDLGVTAFRHDLERNAIGKAQSSFVSLTGSRQTQSVAVALGKRVDARVNERFEETGGDGAVHAILQSGPAQSTRLAAEFQETGCRHIAGARCVLRQMADQPFGFERLFLDVESAHQRFSRSLRHETGDDAHGGLFTCTTRPEKPEDFPLGDIGTTRRPPCPYSRSSSSDLWF